MSLLPSTQDVRIAIRREAHKCDCLFACLPAEIPAPLFRACRVMCRDKGALDEDEARRMFQQLVVAMDYCHQLGVVNR